MGEDLVALTHGTQSSPVKGQAQRAPWRSTFGAQAVANEGHVFAQTSLHRVLDALGPLEGHRSALDGDGAQGEKLTGIEKPAFNSQPFPAVSVVEANHEMVFSARNIGRNDQLALVAHDFAPGPKRCRIVPIHRR